MSVVLCGCETWSLALRELPRLRVLENEVLRKIFEQKLGGCERLREEMHNENILTRYYSRHQIKMNGMGGACGTYERQEKFVHDFCCGTPEKKETTRKT